MKESGYSAQFRQEVIECGVKGYEKQVERDRKRECPLHRHKGYEFKERQRKVHGIGHTTQYCFAHPHQMES